MAIIKFYTRNTANLLRCERYVWAGCVYGPKILDRFYFRIYIYAPHSEISINNCVSGASQSGKKDEAAPRTRPVLLRRIDKYVSTKSISIHIRWNLFHFGMSTRSRIRIKPAAVNLLIHYRATSHHHWYPLLSYYFLYTHITTAQRTHNSIWKMDRPLIFMIILVAFFLAFLVVQANRMRNVTCKWYVTYIHSAGIILLRHSGGYAK